MLPISKTSAGPTMISSQRSLPTDEGITSSAPLGMELEQGALEPLVREQVASGPREHDTAFVQQVGARSEREQSAHVLAGGEDREPAGRDGVHGLAEAVGHRALEPQERVVEAEEPRAGHEAASEGEHLLLAAGEDLGWRLLLVREDREEREDGPERLVTSRPRPRQEGAELEVLADGKRAEQTPPLGDHGEPARRDLVRRPPVDDLAAEPDHAGADRQEARERPQERGLARAVGPHQRDELAGADLERETAQHLEIAVAGVNVADFQERRQGSSSPRYASAT